MQNGDIYVYSFGNYNWTTTKYGDPAIMTLQNIMKNIDDAIGVDIRAMI